jgi:hypothetical protein
VNFQKTRLVASREYAAAVRSKSFLASLIIFPILMSGAIIAQRVSQKIGDTNTYRVAVMNGSGDAALYGVIRGAVDYHNHYELMDSSGRQVRGRFILESAAPVDWNDKAALDEARLALSNRVRSGELLAFVEIGPTVLKGARTEAGGGGTIRYCSNRPTYQDFIALLRSALPAAIVHQRLVNAGSEFTRLEPLLWWPPVVQAGLAEQKAGKITYQSDVAQAANIFVPLILVVLMFMVTLMGTSPMAANVIEEKQLRIAEVLLGSVTPMELMMGKLLGGVGVSLTLAAIFVGGGVLPGIFNRVFGLRRRRGDGLVLLLHDRGHADVWVAVRSVGGGVREHQGGAELHHAGDAADHPADVRAGTGVAESIRSVGDGVVVLSVVGAVDHGSAGNDPAGRGGVAADRGGGAGAGGDDRLRVGGGADFPGGDFDAGERGELCGGVSVDCAGLTVAAEAATPLWRARVSGAWRGGFAGLPRPRSGRRGGGSWGFQGSWESVRNRDRARWG